jgi:hypothetical protein
MPVLDGRIGIARREHESTRVSPMKKVGVIKWEPTGGDEAAKANRSSWADSVGSFSPASGRLL